MRFISDSSIITGNPTGIYTGGKKAIPADNSSRDNISDVFVKSEEDSERSLSDLQRISLTNKSDTPRSFKNRMGRGLRTAVLFTTMLSGLTANICGNMMFSKSADSDNLRIELVDGNFRQAGNEVQANTLQLRINDMGQLVEYAGNKADMLKTDNVTKADSLTAISREEVINNYIENNLQQYNYKEKKWDAPSEKAVDALKKSLETFDTETVRNLEKAGIKCLVMKNNRIPQDLKDRGLKEWNADVGALYAYDEKMVFLRQDMLTTSCIIHEYGHAIDDMLMVDQKTVNNKVDYRFKGENDPQLVKLYDKYMERTERVTTGMNGTESRSGSWSDYARTNPREYVAEGVRMYLESKYTNKNLKKMDPDMFEYVGKLLESSKGTMDFTIHDAPQAPQAQ